MADVFSLESESERKSKNKSRFKIKSFVLAVFALILLVIACMFFFFFYEFRSFSQSSDRIEVEVSPYLSQSQKTFINIDSLRFLTDNIRETSDFASARNSFYNAQAILVDLDGTFFASYDYDNAEMLRQLQIFWYKRLKLEGLREKLMEKAANLVYFGTVVSKNSEQNKNEQDALLGWIQHFSTSFSGRSGLRDSELDALKTTAMSFLAKCQIHEERDLMRSCRKYEENYRSLMLNLVDFQHELSEFNIVYDYFRNQLNSMVLENANTANAAVKSKLSSIKSMSNNTEIVVFFCLLALAVQLAVSYLLINRYVSAPMAIIARMIKISHSRLHRPRSFPSSRIVEIDDIFRMLPKVFDDLYQSRVEARNSNKNYMRLLDVSMKDELTGVLNRRALEAFIARNAIVPVGLCIMMVDIDHFKNFNDERGHQYGDYILKLIAATLSNSLSEKSADRVFRFGGEEFVIVVQEIESRMRRPIAERLLERVRALHVPNSANDTGLLTISIGCSQVVTSDVAVSVSALIAQADVALYEAKRQGRNRVIMADKN